MDNKEISNIIEKSRVKIAISNFKEEDVKMPHKKQFKIVATFILSIAITTTLVYAGSVVYDKIWKEPESYTIKRDLTEEEKNKCISEEEAEKIGNSYLKKIGMSNENIEDLGLTKEFLSDKNIWVMGSQKATLTIDGNTGTLKSVNIPTWKYKIPYNYGITRKEAIKVAKELLEKYRPEGDNSEYELIKLTRNMETDKGSYIWYADFQKKYDNLINSEESIFIGWVPTINGLYCLNIKNNVYEDNEQKISKEDAIKTATDKDKSIETNKTIKGTEAEIRIKKMNEQVYLREKFKDEYENGTLNLEKTGDGTYKLKEDATFYKTDERVRKVWCVVIKYNINEEDVNSAYTYYVDTTTGEIIGGQRYNELETENLIYNDEYNLIEK